MFNLQLLHGHHDHHSHGGHGGHIGNDGHGGNDGNGGHGCHGDELMLLFGASINFALPADDKKMSQDLVRWWTNFAKYG